MENKTTNNIITAVLSAISTAFSKFVGVFKKNGLVYTMIVLIFFVLTYSLIINPIRLDNLIEQKLQHQWQKEQEHITTTKTSAEEKRLKADEIVTPIVDDIQQKFNIDRVMLLESHNNSTNISGIDFLFYSATYESINLDDNAIDYVADSFQRQYIQTLLGKELYIRLKHQNYLYFNDLNEYKRNKSRLLIKLKKFGENQALLIPIRNSKQQPVLIMVCANRNEIDAEKIYTYINHFLNQIGQSLIIS